MTPVRQLRFWLIGLLVFGVVVWLLRDVLMPFVAGMAIAYVLDPVCDRLERLGHPRWLATTLVLLVFVLAIVLVLLVIVPVLISQIGGFLASLPALFGELNEFLLPVFGQLRDLLGLQDVEELRSVLSGYAGDAVAWLGQILGGVWRSGVAVLDIISLLVITPLVAFYLLRDWDRMVAVIDDLMPRHHAATIRELAGEVNQTLSGFMRGQALVCLILGIFYAVALSLVGLNFGLVVGLGAGLISFIPYVGSIVGFVTSIGIALGQFDDWTMWLVVAVIFVLGQAVEGNFLTPKLVGDSVGLHPVWIVFALLAAGSLFGFTGLLLAVPVAAVIGVVVRFFLRQYRRSPYFLGDSDLTTLPSGDEGEEHR